MRKSLLRIATGLSCCALLITSCSQFSDIDEIEDVEFEAEYALPLINSTSSLLDLLLSTKEDLSELTVDEQGNFIFYYEDQGPEKKADEIYDNAFSFPFALLDTFVSVPVALFENIAVHQMDIRSGQLQFEFISQHSEDIEVEVVFPQMTKDGSVFKYTYQVNYDGNAPTQVSTPSVSVEGYTLNTTNNQLEMRYRATRSNGQSVMLSLVGGQAQNWEYDYMEGLWAKDEFGLEKDTLNIDVFEEKFTGEVSFADPKLTIILENSFGFPVMAQVNSLQMIDEFGTVLELESTLFDDGLHLDYPTINEVNASKTTTITFDRTNSNIVELLNSQPQQVIYDLAVVVNPNEISNEAGFITTDSKIKVTIQTEVPVHGTLSDLTVEKTVETDFNDADELTHAEFKLIAENGLPINVDLQFYFLDEDESIMDSLFTEVVHPLNAASVDSEGNVTQDAKMVTTVSIPADRMNLLKYSKNMMMKAGMSTSNDGTSPVKMNSEQTLNIKLGAIVGIKK